MSENPSNPSMALADLLESLRMAGIRHLPRTVAGFEMPLPVASGPESVPNIRPAAASIAVPSSDVPEVEVAPPIPRVITPVAPPVSLATPVVRADSIPAVAPSGTLFELERLPASAMGAPLTAQERLDRLAQLAEEVSRCSKCKELARGRTQTVFGVGPIDPELCVIGEAPGAQEDLKGEPFVGDAGQLLDKILKACGFERSQVYICNILRCRPPANRTPDPVEAQNCRPFLEATLSLVKPRFLCLMGATAARYLLETSSGIGALRGRELVWRGIPAAATYHPAYLLRYPDKKHDAWDDMKRMLARMGRSVPGA